MNIINSYNKINSIQEYKTLSTVNQSGVVQKTEMDNYKPDIMDAFCSKVVNQNDLNDMVTVPRTIFKGYLCFTAGTCINTAASVFKKSKISKGLIAIGSLLSIYGTYNFVKPYLLHEKDLTKQEK